MNATALKATVALLPVSILFFGSLLLFARRAAASSFLHCLAQDVWLSLALHMPARVSRGFLLCTAEITRVIILTSAVLFWV